MLAKIQVRGTAWDALLADWDVCRVGVTCDITDTDMLRLLRTGRLVTGYWNAPTDFITVAVTGSQTEIDAFYNYFAPADRASDWKWNDDGTVDFATEYTGQQDDILLIHKDHITYDVNGNPTGSAPATFENPNWANRNCCRDTNDRFARSVDRSFDGSFA